MSEFLKKKKHACFHGSHFVRVGEDGVVLMVGWWVSEFLTSDIVYAYTHFKYEYNVLIKLSQFDKIPVVSEKIIQFGI